MVFKSDKQRKFVMAKLKGGTRSNVTPKFIVIGERKGKEKVIRTFTKLKPALLFKNLIKTQGEIFPSKSAFKKIRVEAS